MRMRANTIGRALLSLLIGGLTASGEARAQKRGGHAGGHAPHAPHVAAPRTAPRPPRMPQPTAPSHRNALPSSKAPSHPQNQAQGHARRARPGKTTIHPGNSAGHVAGGPLASSRGTTTRGAAASGTSTGLTSSANANPFVLAPLPLQRGLTMARTPSTYTYGTGAGARRYRAYGYGPGYRNRFYGAGYGYGRSQGTNRVIVARLRSVYSGLARLDRDYQGHRVRAMRAISQAIRQLSYRSMAYTGAGFAPGLNQGPAAGGRRSVLAGAGRGGQPMPQAQSDALMGRALRTLQGVEMQLTSLGSSSLVHARAQGYVGHAMQELQVALSIR